jgi:hypothetical protein
MMLKIDQKMTFIDDENGGGKNDQKSTQNDPL